MTDEGDDLEAAGAAGLKDIQKKTFTKWINSQLEKSSASKGGRISVTDLFYDLRDGRVLLEVLEVVTGKKIPRERGSLRIHQISNVTTALKAIRDEQRVSLVNISAVDIVDGNPKMTLALVWNLVLCYQFHKVLKTLPLSDMERALLAWCRKSVSGMKPAIPITDFSRSFSDGLAFNAILHNYRPNLFDMDLVLSKTPLARLDFAFRMMNQHLGLARLLDPEDIQVLLVQQFVSISFFLEIEAKSFEGPSLFCQMIPSRLKSILRVVYSKLPVTCVIISAITKYGQQQLSITHLFNRVHIQVSFLST